MAKITWIKEFGRRIYVTFKLWLISLFGLLALSIFLGTSLLFFLPFEVRLTLLPVYVLLAEIMLHPLVQLVTGSISQVASSIFYNRKHKPKEYYLPDSNEIAETMKIKYDKPIYVTDNPSIRSPFTNVFTGKIYFPAFVMEEFHRTEIGAIFGHELAHIKHRFRLIAELSLATFATWIFAMLLAQFAVNLMIFVLAELAFMMLMLCFVLRRNEDLADSTSGDATTPEALVSVLQYFKAKCKRDDGSITHRPLQARIGRLENMYDLDCKKQDS